MKIPLTVIELAAVDETHAEVRICTSPEGARFLARFFAVSTEEAKFVEIVEVGTPADPTPDPG